MNAWTLSRLIQYRIPNLDPNQYLRALNEAYVYIVQEITQLVDNYYVQQKTFTIEQATDTFDLISNSNGALSGSIGDRLYSIQRIRILQPGDVNWVPTIMSYWMDPSSLAMSQNVNLSPLRTGPYYTWPYGRGQIKMAGLQTIGAQMEITFTAQCLPLAIVDAGTVSVSGNNVTGTGTSFTGLVAPDYQQYLPGVDPILDQDAEIIFNPPVLNPGDVVQVSPYKIATVVSDTALTLSASGPSLSNVSFALATVPDFPSMHHSLLGDIATRNLFSFPGKDQAQFMFWDGMVQRGLLSMKNSMQVRQNQNTPQRQRFRYGVIRRSYLNQV